MPKKSKKVPVFTTGDVNIPSTPFVPNKETIYVNAYDGIVLQERPTYKTPTGVPKGHKNEFFHGGIKLPGDNVVMCHFHPMS